MRTATNLPRSFEFCVGSLLQSKPSGVWTALLLRNLAHAEGRGERGGGQAQGRRQEAWRTVAGVHMP